MQVSLACQMKMMEPNLNASKQNKDERKRYSFSQKLRERNMRGEGRRGELRTNFHNKNSI
jgi:hypothetical protein